MPNWCTNTLTVTGPAKEIKRFITEATSLPIEGIHSEELFVKLLDGPIDDGEYLDFNNLVPKPKKIVEAPYTNVGYNWEHKNWGVKWGASDSEIDIINDRKVVYNFMTPWGTADQFFIKVSKKFPSLKFVTDSEEPGGDFFCVSQFSNGIVTTLEHGRYFDRHEEELMDMRIQEAEMNNAYSTED